MSGRYWLLAIALGGCPAVWVPAIGYSQDRPEAPIEGDTVPKSGADQSNPTGESNNSLEQSGPIDLTPALQSIETAIRSLIPEVDQTEQQGKIEREIRDLNAQESMASWTERMFWASAAAVALTLVGLLLIWRTLHHTRRAANAADDAVKQAQLATVATQEAVAITRNTAEKQLRAYVMVEVSKILDLVPGRIPRASIGLKNSGQTPASNVKTVVGFRLGAYPPVSFDFSINADEAFSSAILGPQGGHELGTGEKISAITHEQMAGLKGGEMALYLWSETTYDDGFSPQRRRTKFRAFCSGKELVNSGRFSILNSGNEYT